jgi:hypothetical protein
MKQAFYDSMPSSWRERFESAGHLNSSIALAQVLRCFCQQEKLAIQRQGKNERTQHRDSKGKDNRRDALASSHA